MLIPSYPIFRMGEHFEIGFILIRQNNQSNSNLLNLASIRINVKQLNLAVSPYVYCCFMNANID